MSNDNRLIRRLEAQERHHREQLIQQARGLSERMGRLAIRESM